MENINYTSKGLLDRLRADVGCFYLSDLCQPMWLFDIQRALPCYDAEEYSLKEWTDAVQYVVGFKKAFATVQDAKEYLMAYRSI
ncbi:MAG: hypothetical protein RR683_08845, partial [Lachnospiraceae bacterium]